MFLPSLSRTFVIGERRIESGVREKGKKGNGRSDCFLRASFALSRVIWFALKGLLTGHVAIAPTNTDVDANYSGSIQRGMLITSR